jgi:glutamate formiminotransferase/formiminotetrahydrofolate cyclodeaminase
VVEAMVREGNPSSVSDAGVGAIALHAAVQGSWLNVQINAADVRDLPEVQEILASGEKLVERSGERKTGILSLIHMD